MSSQKNHCDIYINIICKCHLYNWKQVNIEGQLLVSDTLIAFDRDQTCGTPLQHQ